MLQPWRMNSFTSLISQLAFNIPVYNDHFSIGEAKSWDHACDIHSLTFPFYVPVTWGYRHHFSVPEGVRLRELVVCLM